MTDDYEYDYYPDDDDDEVDEVDQEQFHHAWIAEFVGNTDHLEKQLGRTLTNRELDNVAEMLQDTPYPDVHGAYEAYYQQPNAKEPNLDDSVSRQEYLADGEAEEAA